LEVTYVAKASRSEIRQRSADAASREQTSCKRKMRRDARQRLVEQQRWEQEHPIRFRVQHYDNRGYSTVSVLLVPNSDDLNTRLVRLGLQPRHIISIDELDRVS